MASPKPTHEFGPSSYHLCWTNEQEIRKIISMKIRIQFSLERRPKPYEKRWGMIFLNSSIAMLHHDGQPNYIRYEGRRYRLWFHWGSKRNLKKPTIYYELNNNHIKRRELKGRVSDPLYVEPLK
jgi:hypothetical protein